MLNEKTSSANNLRIQSSRRHDVRNLRAKVRSMLPEEICPKESKRLNKSRKLERFFKNNEEEIRHSHHLQKDKRLIKQLQKLSQKELEQINENKYYFLGNSKVIEQFDQFVKDSHPVIKDNQWASPSITQSGEMLFTFTPPFYSSPKDKGSRRSLTSSKKRGSTATSVYLQKCESVANRQFKSQLKSFKELEVNILQRKQTIQEQLKAKRQISSVHLQRQQHIAEINRTTLLKLRVQKAKLSGSLSKFSKYKDKADSNHAFDEERDVLELTSKLRKICLKKYKKNVTNQ